LFIICGIIVTEETMEIFKQNINTLHQEDTCPLVGIRRLLNVVVTTEPSTLAGR